MDASFLQVIILAVIQGLAELLPVSSSAHVIIAERLMGLDPSAPAMTFLLVMLHTGTMFAVILYFWPKWRAIWQGQRAFEFLKHAAVATACTGVVGLGLKKVIEKVFMAGAEKAEIEQLFKNLPLMAASLVAAAVVIIIGGYYSSKKAAQSAEALSTKSAAVIGFVQGLCLPFRGFSRSGATISVGLLQRLSRDSAETFSFTLAVILTPVVVVMELHRLLQATHDGGAALDSATFTPGLIGMVFSFIAGLGALRWLSSWLEHGRWQYFGFYCLVAAGFVLAVHFNVAT